MRQIGLQFLVPIMFFGWVVVGTAQAQPTPFRFNIIFMLGSSCLVVYQSCSTVRDCNGVEWVRRMGSSPPSRMVLSYSIPAPPSQQDRKIFLPNSHPLGPHEILPYPVKLYFLFICPLLLQFFLIKFVSLIKIYLKLQINLSHQIKLIFSKNLIIFLKC